MSEWQPIGTAPRDVEMPFLAWDGIGICLGWWTGEEHYFTAADGYSCEANEAIPFTHWMPLPEPPEQNENETR